MKSIFAFGHGYSGTHLMTHILNTIPNIDCDHERVLPESPHALFGAYVDVYKDKQDPYKVLERERKNFINKIIASGKIYGEVNCMLGYYVEALDEMFKNSKFIFISRDPRTQVRTIYNTGGYNMSAFPEKFDPFWWPTPREDDPIFEKWDNMKQLEKCAWAWNLYYDYILKELDKIDKSKYFHIKFEDMIAGKQLNKLFNFLKMPNPSVDQIKKITNVKFAKTGVREKKPLPKWHAMNLQPHKIIRKYTKETAKKLGYDIV